MDSIFTKIDELVKVLDSGLTHINWRLKSSSRRRLQIDVIALVTGMRPVVMIDYGGIMPQLQHHLCALLSFCQKALLELLSYSRCCHLVWCGVCLDFKWGKDNETVSSSVCMFLQFVLSPKSQLDFEVIQESSVYQHIRVMLIDDMIYLIHDRGLAEYVRSSLNSDAELYLVDLEQDPPNIMTQSGKGLALSHLSSIQEFFSLHFPLERQSEDQLLSPETDGSEKDTPSYDATASESSNLIDLSNCMKDTKISIPTLNGWLLGYPVIYLFSTDHIEDAIYNLSTKSLRIYKILVSRRSTSSGNSPEEELLSFSVPYDLSMGGKNEPWAKAFMELMQKKWESCKHAWKSLRMDVTECYPQAIVL